MLKINKEGGRKGKFDIVFDFGTDEIKENKEEQRKGRNLVNSAARRKEKDRHSKVFQKKKEHGPITSPRETKASKLRHKDEDEARSKRALSEQSSLGKRSPGKRAQNKRAGAEQNEAPNVPSDAVLISKTELESLLKSYAQPSQQNASSNLKSPTVVEPSSVPGLEGLSISNHCSSSCP